MRPPLYWKQKDYERMDAKIFGTFIAATGHCFFKGQKRKHGDNFCPLLFIKGQIEIP